MKKISKNHIQIFSIVVFFVVLTSGYLLTLKLNSERIFSPKGDNNQENAVTKLFTSSSASDYEYEWNLTLGGIYIDGARGVAVDINDNVYVAGYQDISGSNTNRDIVIAKYNPLGEQQWTRYWGGSNDDIAHDLLIDPFDNIFIVGFTKSFDDVDGDAVIIKYNITGHQQWNFTWGGSQFDAVIAIDVDSANNFYIGGISSSFGDIDGDAFLVKFNSNWVEQWNNTWGGSDFEDVGDVHIDNNDDIYISGRSDSLDPSPGEGDAFLNKYNSSGDLQWSRNWGGSYTQMASGIATDSLNDVYITGMTFGHPSSSGKSMIVKYNSEGTYQWEEIWGVNGVYANYMYRIIIDSNDDLYVSGTTRSYGIPNNNDAILFNYDKDGNQNWYKIWSEYEWDLCFGLCMDSQSNIYLVGDTKSYSIGQNDILLLKYAFMSNIPYIDIITPENITYTEPMNGYYPGTYGFENEEDGELGAEVAFITRYDSDHSEAYARIEDNINGRNKVLKFYDAATSNNYNFYAYHDFPTKIPYGTVEFWVLNTIYSGDPLGIYYHFSNSSGAEYVSVDTFNSLFYLIIDGDNNGLVKIQTGNGERSWSDLYSDDTWHHVRIDFESSLGGYLGLERYKLNFWFDGIQLLSNEPLIINDSLGVIASHSHGWDDTRHDYLDAVGFSWDPNYNIGDNLNEGLLLSYENTTDLDWKGYTLDGQANRTILGNTTILMPSLGIHTIQLFGNDSLGSIFQSSIKYFSITPINLITPENKTYTEPDSGYYPSTFGFENELNGISGVAIDYVHIASISSDCEIRIYDDFQGHKKVLRIHDGNTNGNAAAEHHFPSTRTTGSVEWWWSTSVSGSNNIAYHFHEGILGTHAGRILMWDNTFQDMESNIIQSYVANQWYHFKIIFNTISDTYDLYIDGILRVDDGSFLNPVTNIGTTNLKGGWTSSGTSYVDAIGYSWDTDYSIGDNLKEGLLLSYTNDTTLAWIGYSLDGSSNFTIRGNKVISLPENGIHSIILSGITSVGTSVKSDLRFFTIIIQDPPIPPLPPPELPYLIPLILTSAGIGIIVILGITLFIFRLRRSSPIRSTVISRKIPQLDEKAASGSDQFKVCPFCYTQIKKTHKFCVSCGASLKN